MNSNTIEQEINVNIQNLLYIKENDVPPWNLTFELFNKCFNNVFLSQKETRNWIFYDIKR